MYFYRITILLKDGSKKSGIRKLHNENIYLAEKEVWNKVSLTIGRVKVERIEISPLPADDPAVAAWSLQTIK